MPDQSDLLQVTGIEEALNELSFLESLKINDEYLIPAMKDIGGSIKKVEKPKIPIFSGKTQRSITSKISTNGIGSVTLTVGPTSKRKFVFRFISGGAQWHDRGENVSTWRGKERNRNTRSQKAINSGGAANPSYLPAASLVEWVKKKLNAGDNALQVAFRVAKAIGKRGLPEKPIVPPTVEEVERMVVEKLNAAVFRMVEEIHSHDKG